MLAMRSLLALDLLAQPGAPPREKSKSQTVLSSGTGRVTTGPPDLPTWGIPIERRNPAWGILVEVG